MRYNITIWNEAKGRHVQPSSEMEIVIRLDTSKKEEAVFTKKLIKYLNRFNSKKVLLSKAISKKFLSEKKRIAANRRATGRNRRGGI